MAFKRNSSGIFVTNTATTLSDANRGQVVICGSHGGNYPAYLGAAARVKALILNDAGGGLEDAGIAGIARLDSIGLAGAAVSHQSARIGDGADMLARGRLSYCNAAAIAVGCIVGMPCADAAELLKLARMSNGVWAPITELRWRLRAGPPAVNVLDSIANVTLSDIGTILISGSHGGLIGPLRSAVKVDAMAAVYHDACGGIDGAGFTRLPALDAFGIAGATVAGTTARIGDGRSVWETGVLSAINESARRFEARVGMTTQEFVAAMERSQGDSCEV